MPNYTQAFERHAMRRETGKTWICRRPDSWIYGFRVTWIPGSIVLTGDVGEMVVNHYSFGEPWGAAAWVRGAGWSYFMEKSQFQTEYDSEETAKFILEVAYRDLRDDWGEKDFSVFQRMYDELGIFCHGDPMTVEGRKQIARDLLSAGEGETLTAEEVYRITRDPEMILYRYSKRHRWKFEAIKWWAEEMWRNEPYWHWALRMYRRYRRPVLEWARPLTHPPRPWIRQYSS